MGAKFSRKKKIIKRPLSVFIVIGVLVLLTLFFNTPHPSLSKYLEVKQKLRQPAFAQEQTPVANFYTEKEVPELKEILSDNQEVRIKAGRKLVERVDVEKAQEILEHSSLPHTGEGHLVVHQIGFYAYQKYGLEAILKCKDYFLYACFHGAIIEAASNQGVEAIAKMTDKCKQSALRYFQCAHAAGHAILAMWNYDLPNALTTCDEIFEKETQFQGALSSCHNGAFMENLFGVHDWGTDKAPKRDWLSDDPYFPCNAFSQKYQQGCWLNQAARIYQMAKRDLVATANSCQKIGNEQYTAWCMDNLARQIHPLTAGSINKVFELCQYLGSGWTDNCIIVNSGSYYSVGDSKSAIEICQRISQSGKGACYQQLISQIQGDFVDNGKKVELCNKLEDPFRYGCQNSLLTTPP